MPLIKFLVSDKNRKIKLYFAIIILFCLSIYSYNYGKSEITLMAKVEKNFNQINSFPYLKTVAYEKEHVIFKDKWGYFWKSKWPKAEEIPALGLLVSFKGQIHQSYRK